MEERLLKQLKREASLHGMCRENRLALDSTQTKAEAIALYKKTIDWALEEGYPGMNVLRTYFSDCQGEGVYIDHVFTGETLIDLPVYVFHNCSGIIRVGLNVEKKIIPMLYFADGCDMSIKSANSLGLRTRVPLYVFGENRVIPERSENIVCVTYNFDVK